MRFQIDAVKVFLQTDQGLIKNQFDFKPGLNVIRGNNSSGKSSLISAIYYALGFEIILGKKGAEALRSVFFKSGKSEKKAGEFTVLESYVLLQVTNSSGNTITLRRYAKSDHINPKLIEVAAGDVLSHPEQKIKWQPYFLHDPGAASHEQGFHHYLASFLQLQLPEVLDMNGRNHPLYLECLFPLMAIEQKNGWGSIQRTTPSYGIKGIREIAFEYLLDLDVFELQRKKSSLRQNETNIKNQFDLLHSECKKLASEIGGVLCNFPCKISSVANDFYIEIMIDGKTFDQDSFLLYLRQCLERNKIKQKEMLNGSELQQRELENTDQQISILERRFSDIKNQWNIEKSAIGELIKHRDSILHDIAITRDLIKLKNYGAESIDTSKNICPVCSQRIPESLDVSDRNVMSLEENLSFLESEKDALNALCSGKEKSVAMIESLANQMADELNILRNRSRDLNYDLTHGGGVSRSLLREEIQLSEKIAFVSKKIEMIDELNKQLHILSQKYGDYLANRETIPTEYFSELDQKKIAYFSDKFADLLKVFHCTNQAGEIQISKENYKPMINNLDLVFDSSATDGIRMIWSYTIALMLVSQQFTTNHFGIVFFDEPGQHQMDESDFASFIQELATCSGFQIILATSVTSAKVHSLQEKTRFNLLESNAFIFDFD
ncbi:MAG: AAA family ATPase [Lentisphaeria bacterium]|nr:AAA family ATPase [Lentisphaeria bacterium]